MNRKLHNTVTALTLASVGLVLVLAVAQPVAPSAPPAGLSALPINAPQGLRAPTAFDATSASDASASSGKPRPSRRMRQNMAMPFFSFAPRG